MPAGTVAAGAFPAGGVAGVTDGDKRGVTMVGVHRAAVLCVGGWGGPWGGWASKVGVAVA
jgi:hypothetical protein